MRGDSEPKATSADVFSNAVRLMEESPSLEGGTQSLEWVADSLQRDDDGDEAHGFIVADQR